MAAPVDVNWTTLLTTGAIGLGLGWVALDAYNNRRWHHETASAYGSASWATKRELKRTGLLGPSGAVLGRYAGKLVRLETDRHLLTIATNRSGKGVSSIVPNLLTWPGSMVVIDPKGENAVITARHRREMGQAVHVLDPWGITGLPRSRFNPLRELSAHHEDFVEDVTLHADGLVMSDGHQDSEFWVNESRALIAGIEMQVATTQPPERRHLGLVRRYLTAGDTDFDWLLDEMSDNGAAFGLVARAADRIRQKSDIERSSVISSAQAQTHFLDSPRMVDVLSASDLDLGDLKRGNMTLYLVLPAERLATHGRWLRLMIGLCIAALTRDRTPPPHPVLFLLDEFAALGRLQAIETAMGLLAGYGVQLWPILQDLSQLEDLYPHRWRSFLASAGAIQAFGVNDKGTAEYLSAMLGNRTVIVRQQGRSSAGERESASENYGVAGRPLLMPQEILQLAPDKQLVLLQGRPPILADKLRYYRDREFAGLFDPNPMIRSV